MDGTGSYQPLSQQDVGGESEKECVLFVCVVCCMLCGIVFRNERVWKTKMMTMLTLGWFAIACAQCLSLSVVCDCVLPVCLFLLFVSLSV